jgi:hypothetical protein
VGALQHIANPPLMSMGQICTRRSGVGPPEAQFVPPSLQLRTVAALTFARELRREALDARCWS